MLKLAMLCGLLSGCAAAHVDDTGQPAALLSQVPTESITVAGNYQRIASCSYQRLDKVAGTGIKKIDLPAEQTSRLALESGGVRYWELVFSAIDAGHTRVQFTRVQTIWGPLGSREVMPEVKACTE